jgi:hypothetical protein
MPKPKRSPIDYSPQFGGGIFRPKETVDEELAELEGNPPALDEEAEASGPLELAPILSTEHSPTAVNSPITPRRTNGRTNERSNERTVERQRVRHSFDIWQDQLLGLTEIQAERFSRNGRKPKLGDLVQEALDAYIARERKRTNVRTNER